MKTKKLIRKLGALLEGREGQQGPERVALEELLRRLGEKERQLTAKLASEPDADRSAKLHKKIKLVRAQLRKGAEALDSLA